MTAFDRALAIILHEEGDYSDHSKDPGGRTMHGITEATARIAGYTGDMRDLTLAQAADIYRVGYWAACRCDELPWPLALYVFDAAVNQGGNAAIKMLQRALVTVQDGKLGPVTLRLAQASTPWHWSRFMAFRVMRYQSTRGFDVFGPGWLSRCFRVTLAGAA